MNGPVAAELQRHVVPPAIDAELLNWGRWARPGGGGGAGSSLWRFAARGSRVAAYHGATVVVPVDVEQAQAVERIVCNARFSPLMRGLLRAHYVVNMHPQRTCRELGLAEPTYGEWVWRAAMHYRDHRPLAGPAGRALSVGA